MPLTQATIPVSFLRPIFAFVKLFSSLKLLLSNFDHLFLCLFSIKTTNEFILLLILVGGKLQFSFTCHISLTR